MAGVMLIAMGIARLGQIIKFIPFPVVTGFTSGIAVVIFSSQVKDLLGLRMGDVPAAFLQKWAAFGGKLSDCESVGRCNGGDLVPRHPVVAAREPPSSRCDRGDRFDRGARSGVWPAGRDRDLSLRRAARDAPAPRLPEPLAGRHAIARRSGLQHCLAGRYRVAPIGSRRRRDDRLTPPLQCGARCARHRESGDSTFRWYPGNRRHCAHCDECEERRPYSGGRDHARRGTPVDHRVLWQVGRSHSTPDTPPPSSWSSHTT